MQKLKHALSFGLPTEKNHSKWLSSTVIWISQPRFLSCRLIISYLFDIWYFLDCPFKYVKFNMSQLEILISLSKPNTPSCFPPWLPSPWKYPSPGRWNHHPISCSRGKSRSRFGFCPSLTTRNLSAVLHVLSPKHILNLPTLCMHQWGVHRNSGESGGKL